MNFKPEYFHRIADRSAKRWDQLQADAELAGPWRQLFSQVQSPRHVLSEMLQNADDAGASWVRVAATDGTFVFEHNGRDFEEDEFESLCRFGYSNKRSLHTIGFRGIGFKSLFSLGKSVALSTPTLSVVFHADRFTQPHWIERTQPCNKTRIEVRIEDENRVRELHKNLDQWRSSPLSLLFFGSIARLQIDGHEVYKEQLGPGPSPGSHWVSLKGSKYERLLHVRSAEESFPAEAIEEIKKERITEDLNLPPCRVELVVGHQDQSRLFVVLPTGVTPNLPFSAHAPFLQDPARFGIKEPATSPTNRWLLDRVGRLAADTMCDWLASLPVEARAEAYGLLPPPGANGDTLDASVTEQVSFGFRSNSLDRPVLLLQCGDLGTAGQAVAMPSELTDAWPEPVLKQVLRLGDRRCLSSAISDGHKHQLQAWAWIKSLSDHDAIDALLAGEEIPRPVGPRETAALWTYVARANYTPYSRDWRSDVRIVPVEGGDHLCSAKQVVRLSSRRSDVPESEWSFLAAFVHVVDGRWLQSLREAVNATSGNATDNTRFAKAAALLKELGLDAPTSVDRLVERACHTVTRQGKISRQLLVRLTHLCAALDATVPEKFPYVNRRDRQIVVADGVMLDIDDQLEEILPDEFCERRIVHSDYQRELVACSAAQWRSWVTSPKSRLSAFTVLQESCQYFRTREGFESHLGSLGFDPPVEYRYRSGGFEIREQELAPEVFAHLCKIESVIPGCWTTLVRAMLSGPTEHWQSSQYADVREVSTNGYECKAKVGNLPAKWIRQLAQKPCLLDTHGRHRVPADLLLRTPDTEPLMAIEAFVAAEIDTPQNRPLLLRLGARDTPTGTERLVDRIRAIAACENPPLHELFRWYEALDGVAARAQPQELAELRKAFTSSRLIWTNEGQWSLASEVFCFADRDTMPDAATIHESLENLPLWKRLGVPDRPTLPLIIDWLVSLETGSKLETQTARRVQACLKAFPSQVYDQVNAWLSLDNRWLRLDQFRYKHRTGSNLRISDLFVAAKSHTADLRGIPDNRLGGSRFAHVSDLSTAISCVVSEVVEAASIAHPPDWLVVLGRCLARFTHETAEVQERVRCHGIRMAESSWQEVVSIKVTPYLDGTPVGQPLRPSCLWAETTLYVGSASLVEIIDSLADELQQPFEMPTVAEAIRICIDRRSEFIQRYLDDKFDLQPVAEEKAELATEADRRGRAADETPAEANGNAPDSGPPQWQSEVISQATPHRLLATPLSTGVPRSGSVDSNSSESGPPAGAPVAEVPSPAIPVGEPTDSTSADQPDGKPSHTPRAPSSEAGWDGPGSVSGTGNGTTRTETSSSDPSTSATPDRSHEEPRQSMIDRFAQLRGFRYNDAQRAFYAEDGTRMLRCSGLFNCEIYDPSDTLVLHVWLSPQSLSAGLEIPADVWDMIRSNPNATTIAYEGPGGKVVECKGNELLRMLEDETIRLFPAKYRLRQIRETSEAVGSSSPGSWRD